MTALHPPRSKKSLGQHFLIDPNIVRKIIAAAELTPDKTVLEIGPGRGALTFELCRLVSQVVAVEVDPELVAYLQAPAASRTNLRLEHGDALRFSFDSLPQGTVVVANLPYYLSTPLLFRLLEQRGHWSRLILMLQKEVATRIVAQANTREYGALSVVAQQLADPSLLFKVSPNCFTPRPDVESAVIKVTPRNTGFTQQDVTHFTQTVQAAFGHRRKTVVNSYRDAGWPVQTIRAALSQAGINPTRRAETLTVQEFSTLATLLFPRSPSQETEDVPHG